MLPLLRPHRAALFTVVIVGLMYGLPNVFFMLSLGNEYRGIPMLQTPNEGSYLARIQEVDSGRDACFKQVHTSRRAVSLGVRAFASPHRGRHRAAKIKCNRMRSFCGSWLRPRGFQNGILVP